MTDEQDFEFSMEEFNASKDDAEITEAQDEEKGDYYTTTKPKSDLMVPDGTGMTKINLIALGVCFVVGAAAVGSILGTQL